MNLSCGCLHRDDTHVYWERAQEETASLSAERRSERAGRTKAERRLRELQLQLGTKALQSLDAEEAKMDGGNEGEARLSADGSMIKVNGAISSMYPLRPIGTLRSCFSARNGTPRQPLLVSSARSYLEMRPELCNSGALDGLEQYTHVWVIYIFHQNTDLQRLWQSDQHEGVRTKIRVPRLNGERLGVFATRSPHRPSPIGLSCGRIVGTEKNRLLLAGLDVVDGSPVLDLKPYVPFCDSIKEARCPSWVTPSSDEEPLKISCVHLTDALLQDLAKCWNERGRHSMYSDFESLQAFVKEALSIDIRSVAQRVKVPDRIERSKGALPALYPEVGKNGNGRTRGRWHVVLDGIELTYDIDDNGAVTVMSADLASSRLEQ